MESGFFFIGLGLVLLAIWWMLRRQRLGGGVSVQGDNHGVIINGSAGGDITVAVGAPAPPRQGRRAPASPPLWERVSGFLGVVSEVVGLIQFALTLLA